MTNTNGINNSTSPTTYTASPPQNNNGYNCGGVYGTSTSANVYYPSSSNYVYCPNTYTTTSTISLYPSKDKYGIIKLPRREMPNAVYVLGRMVTLGILGADVECAYMEDCLIFAPGVVNLVMLNNHTTIILEYFDEMFHFNIGENGLLWDIQKPNILNSRLISVTKKRTI